MVDTSTEAVTKLLDGVTPGPWTEHDAGKHPYVFVCGPERLYYNGDVKDKPLVAYVTGYHAIQNRSFIAAARDLVPALLAERDALRAEVERLKLQPVPHTEPVAHCGRSSIDIVKSGNPAWMYPAHAGDDLSGSVSLYTAPQPITVQDAAVSDVLAERARQISAEGWTPEHDDEHFDGAIARAAASYALSSAGYPHLGMDVWPWSREWWKPADHRRDLVKAGALILAEIQRLDRAALRAIADAD